MDCKIDGIVLTLSLPVPTASRSSKDATLAFDDPFGYIDQIKGYARSEGETR